MNANLDQPLIQLLIGDVLQEPRRRLVIPSRKALTQLRSFDEEKFADALWAYVDGSFLVRRLYLKRLRNLLRMLPSIPSVRILEIGTGSGIFMCSLKSLSDSVVGIDVHDHLPAVRNTMRQQGFDLDLVRCDVKRLPFRRCSIDLVVGVSVLEHVDPDSLSGVLSEVGGILSSPGYFALGYPVESPLVKMFFKSVGFDFNAQHCSKAADIRKAIKESFGRFVKVKRLPTSWMPDFLSYYETVLVAKDSTP